MSAFNFPPPRLPTVLRLWDLVGLAGNVRRIAAFAGLAVNRFAGIAFIEAKMLRLFGSGIRALDRDGVECGGKQFLIRHIGAFDGDGQRHAAAIDQRRAFDAELAAIASTHSWK